MILAIIIVALEAALFALLAFEPLLRSRVEREP